MSFHHLLASLGISTPADYDDLHPDRPDGQQVPDDSDPAPATSRRRTRRAPIRGFASLQWTGGPSRVFGGLVNVSPDGCLLKTESTIEEGTQVSIRLNFVGLKDDDERESVQATGVVRHRTEVEGRRAYGVEFTDLGDRDDHAVLDAYRHALN